MHMTYKTPMDVFFGYLSIHPSILREQHHTVVVPGCFTNVLRLKIYEGRFVNSSMKEEFIKSVCSMYVYFGMICIAVVLHYIIRSHPSIHPCPQNRQIQFEKCVNCKKKCRSFEYKISDKRPHILLAF